MDWKRNITITTNVSCNLNCIYCYENKNSNHSFNVDNAKIRLSNLLSQRSGGGTTISFHGGEPFLVYDKIKELCEWLWDQHFPEPYRCFATTNGTLIHGDLQNWLYNNRKRFICSLSLDGNRQMQNINRSKSFDLIDISFFTQTWPTQGIKMTISPQTISTLSEGIIFLHKLGISDIRANLSEMTDWNDKQLLSFFNTELNKLSDYYIDNPHIKPCSIFRVPFFKILEKAPIKKWCGIGETPAYDIDSNIVYPCHLFFPSVCGKEKSDSIKTIDFINPQTYVSEHCSACAFLRICPTCYGANFIERGHPSSRDMNLCKYQKVRFLKVAEFEFKRINAIINSDDCNIDISTRRRYYMTIEGIKHITPQLNDVESKCI